MTSRYFCELALVDGRVQPEVLVIEADGRFTAVEPGGSAGNATRLSGLTLPGMANAHSHAFHRALRSRTQSNRGSFWTWRDLMYQAAARLTPDNYRRLAAATFGEMALAGITSVGEFHYVHHQPDGTPYDNPNEMGDALLAAAHEAGIRITLLDTLYLHGGLEADGYTEPAGAQLRYCDGSAEAFLARVEQLKPSVNQQLGAAVHSVRAVDPRSIGVLAQWANDRGAPLHAHVSEQRAENEACLAHHGMTPIALLHTAGALTERFTAVHATHVSSKDIALLSQANATVCMCPTTERDLGDGIGPTAEVTQAGVAITLGSDSHAVIDHFEESRAVELNERLRSEQRGVHQAADLMAMATSQGQSSLGWTDAGAIKVGNRADLVTINLESQRTAGVTPETAVEAAIFAATASDVTFVLADGKVIVSDGEHSSLNVERLLSSSIHELMEAG